MTKNSPLFPQTQIAKCSEAVIDTFPRLHSLVVGPGLGRSSIIEEIVSRVLFRATHDNIPYVDI